MPAPIDLVGQRFGRLTVEGLARGLSGRRRKWRCRCDCGNDTLVATGELREGKSKSCGCLRADTARTMKRTHGATVGGFSPEFESWRAMMERCTNPNHKRWHRYGGRGITVCERWRNFANFLADMGPRPEGRTLDRYPNGDGNYEPGNCRWATVKEQNQNRVSGRLVTYGGVSLTASAWARRFGWRDSVVRERLLAGWPIERALTTQPVSRLARQ